MKIAFVSIAAAMLLIELIWARRPWPQVKGWLLRALSFTSIQVAIVMLIDTHLDEWLVHHQPWSIAHWGEFEATLVALLAMTFVSYWQHRLKHVVPFLWRYLHQVHHSPQRLELLTSFYRNPLEIILNMLIMAAVLMLLVGADPKIALNVVLLLGLADMFYHWNVKTPYWLGFIIQRPESHGLHHLNGVHSHNYGDIVIWDMLFGTFRNLRQFNGKCGFDNDNERKVLPMLLGKDMSEGRYVHAPRQQ